MTLSLAHLKTFLSIAHLQPILALLAGVLILVLPRRLNLIVATYLIATGLIGFGLLKALA